MKKNNLKNFLKILSSVFTLIFININFSFAASGADNGLQGSLNFKEAANNITTNILSSATTLLMTASFVVFFYGIVRFIYDRSSGDDTRLQKDKEAMMWGLIALFVMVSTWGIIKLAQDFLGMKDDNNIQIQSVAFTTPAGIKEKVTESEDNSKKLVKDFASNKYSPCTGKNSKDVCGDELVCQGTNGKAKDTEKGICVTTDELDKMKLEKNSTGNIVDNPFANQTNYPVINIGAKSDLKAGASRDGNAFTLLVGLLKKKNCVTAYLGRDIYKLGDTFGTTYENIDAIFVKSFQKTNGLPNDGIVDKDTWEALSVSTGQKTSITGIKVKDCQ
ncbi:MAG: peptidoglycan-binding protein [Candidatus Pacebacteria bacterium]|nr:peptidoglycan-binding protein [Candidatus Paceibacterota bacterium]